MDFMKLTGKASRSNQNSMRICIACSGGGHLTEVLQIRKSYEDYDHFYLTFRRENSSDLSKKEKVYFVTDPARSIMSFFECTLQTFFILRKERPRVIITTGAGVAVPACFLGRFLFGTKIVYIESFCRIDEPSWTGKILYPIANLFLVQWRKLLAKYGDKAKYAGAVV